MRPASLERYDGGLAVESAVFGDFETSVPAAAELGDRPDVLWVTTKAYQLHDAVSLAPPESVGDAMVVPLMNGIDHVAHLRSRYPNVIAGAIRVESERADVGRILQKSPFARVSLASHPGVESLHRELEDAGIESEVGPDEATLLWQKLAFLAPVALTTSARGGPLGAVRAEPRWRARLEACQREVVAVARAEGAEIDEAALHSLHAAAPDATQSSMQKDLAAGRPLELDAIGGAIVRAARRHGQDVPVTEELIDLVRSHAD